MLVVLNNKCNLLKNDFIVYQNNLNEIKTDIPLVLCPVSTYLSSVSVKNIKLGSQNVSCFDEGAHTGEISATQLKALDVNYCIVGHSERRLDQKETNEEISQKIQKLIFQDITPILCIGETKEERETNRYIEVLTNELKTSIGTNDYKKLIIAYEPIWSIGTGVIPTNEQITEVFNLIKNLYTGLTVLYGGSANSENIDTLKEISLIDGYLLGGLSLKPDKLQVFLDKLND